MLSEAYPTLLLTRAPLCMLVRGLARRYRYTYYRGSHAPQGVSALHWHSAPGQLLSAASASQARSSCAPLTGPTGRSLQCSAGSGSASACALRCLVSAAAASAA